MYTPHPRPFVDGVHVVVYDNSDPDAFFEKLTYYLARPDEARKIAAAGLKHALTHHRAVSRLDFILRSAHELRAADASSAARLGYTHTASLIKHDAASTTQVDPIVDVGSDEFRDVAHVKKGGNAGRRKIPPPMTEDMVKKLVEQNKVHRKSLGFRRRRR